MTPEDKLSAFLAADASPSDDVWFVLAVEQRLARLRLIEAVRRAAVLSAAACAVLFLAAPFIEKAARVISDATTTALAPFAMLAVLIGSTLAFTERGRLIE